jgi:hypothetical protein
MKEQLYYDSLIGLVPIKVLRQYRENPESALMAEVEVCPKFDRHPAFPAGYKFSTRWSSIVKKAQ